ncbi:hypothetical protein TSOC_005343 [Tetrabaena socialis]|uniref:Uncharacterized protein n=1 Tax=Tetrabaena socialis TaxID=47790 RepID=A0A2J8A6K7_9CHLO|nr:hypothetical protein TSOC_005343 [Tetrabaena socialis]|eukprot:PNH08140.1 hypothetical protein TSOC_005343 [Tetrabaena socialis]
MPAPPPPALCGCCPRAAQKPATSHNADRPPAALALLQDEGRHWVHARGLPVDEERGRLQLSPLECATMLHCVNPKALVFGGTLDGGLLREALAETLALYPLLAGRLRRAPGLSALGARSACAHYVSLCNAGALFIEATVAGVSGPGAKEEADGGCAGGLLTLAHLASPGSMARFGFSPLRRAALPAHMEPLDPSAALLGREPLLKVRLTHLRGGGCVLALSLHHAVLDGHSAAMFVNALAASYARLAPAPAPGSMAWGVPTAAVPPAPQPPQPPQPSQPPHWRTPTFGRSALFPADWRLRLAAAPAEAGVEMEGAVKPAAADAVNGSKHFLGGGKAAVVGAFACGDGGGGGSSVAELVPLQVPPPPGWWAALGHVAALVRSAAAEQRRWPGSGWGGDGLTCEVLHLPAECLAQLRVSAAGGRHDISPNDAASSLVWVLMCALRGRPLPGAAAAAAAPGSDKAGGGGGGCLAMALDLRRNLLGHTLPHSYCGMASWCIHVQAQKQQQQQGEYQQPAPAAANISRLVHSGSSAALNLLQATAPSPFLAALRSGASSIRGTLRALRRLPGGGEELLGLVARQITAPASSQAALLARLCVAQDAMVTSWQFPYWQADFGPQVGLPLRYHCLVHPSPPWMAAVMAARPDEGGGLHLLLSVPTSAAAALRQSPVLRELAPGHAFDS